MIHYLIFTVIGLLTITFSAFGQIHNCKIKIVRLKFDKTREVTSGQISDILLVLAKPTDSVLVDDSEIKKFEIVTDTACCTYAGQMFITSHHYLLTKEAVSRLSVINRPLYCAIPVAVYIDEKEVYRAMLWNLFSSFGSKSLTMTLRQDTLIVANQLPNLSDFRNSILKSKKSLVNCLLNR